MKSVPLPQYLLDGRPVASEEAAEHLGSRLAMYGEGCFDTLVSFQGGVLCPGEHLRRLHDGISFLGWMVPASLSHTDAFMDTLGTFLAANGAADQLVRIRIQVWSDDRTVGYRPGTTPSTRFLITGARMESATFPPVSLITSRIRRIPDDALPANVKWTNGINYILAAREAQQKGADDALMLTVDGYVSETTAANLFWVDSGTVFTPSEDCDLLPGITRSILVEVVRESGIPLRTGRFDPSVLQQADAVWMCNSVREICPVTRLDDRRYDAGNLILEEVTAGFENLKHGRLQYVQQA